MNLLVYPLSILMAEEDDKFYPKRSDFSQEYSSYFGQSPIREKERMQQQERVVQAPVQASVQGQGFEQPHQQLTLQLQQRSEQQGREHGSESDHENTNVFVSGMYTYHTYHTVQFVC